MEKEKKTVLIRIIAGIVAFVVLTSIVPALLSASNDFAVVTGVCIIVTCAYFVTTEWPKIAKFFGIIK